MFFETHRGFVGSGAMEVYRTAAQAAADLETMSKDTETMTQYGGLKNQEKAFKYAAAQGRLKDLERETAAISAIIEQTKAELEQVVARLERMGVSGAKQYLLMAAKTVVSFVNPIFGIMAMFGVDPFGMSDKKKRLIKENVKKAEELVKKAQYYNGRGELLQQEGEALSRAMQQGEQAVSVQLVNTPRVEKIVAREADPTKYGPNMVWREKKDLDVKTVKYGREEFASHDELSQRVPSKMAPSGDRLPVGFQTLYSPILEHGKIIVKNAPSPVLSTVTTKPQVVYGGLVSGIGADDNDNKDFFCFMTTAIAAVAMVYGLSTMKR